MKTVAIHQPNFLPWLGYFYKIDQCDVFVLLDDVQYTKNNLINRNKIKTPRGESWLTIPIMGTGRYGQKILDVEIANSEVVFKKVLKTLKANYAKAPFYEEIIKVIEPCFVAENSELVNLNVQLIKLICYYLRIETEMVSSSTLKKENGEATDRLIAICKSQGATSYLAGFGSSKYHDEKKFLSNGIELITSSFEYQEYQQLWGDFIPNLSILDVLFNCGKQTSELLKSPIGDP